jgi:DNA modification methylase
MAVNRLILGDNLEILKGFEPEIIDLIYLDPPFFSNRNYEVIWGDTGEIRSFQDRWAGGISHYIDWLKERVVEMHRILKPAGSIFLHCDWHANAEIKIFILNKIFGEDNFRGEIIWNRAFAHNDAKKKLAVLTDTIWYYSKTDKFLYNPVYSISNEGNYNERFNLADEDGRLYQSVPMDSPNPRPNMMYEWKGYPHPPKGWRYSKETMEELDKKGEIIYPENPKGRLRRKKYLDEAKGALLGNVWTDIINVQGASKERIGYPTQKPEALLERIITMASNEGDIVLDPFMGGGTTIAVSDRLNRQWIGIDQSVQAVKVTEIRLQKQTDLFASPYTVQLYKYDYDTLRYKDAFEFESWIITQFGGTPQNKKGGDKGIDGKYSDGTPIQVKRSDNIGVNVIKNFSVSAKQYDKSLFEKNTLANKQVGYIIAFSFGKGAIEEVSRLKNEENIFIKLVRVDEIIPIAVKPVVGVHINEIEKDNSDGSSAGNRKIEFVAKGDSPAGIEFYSWDFNYDKEKGFKASIIIDKEGKQIIMLKTGTHNIAVKVVDNDGLENMEIIKLKINGEIKREK